MFGLGKKRSKLGKWLDQRGISQQWLSKTSGVNKTTISKLSKGDYDHDPNTKTIKKIINTLQKIDPNVKADDFWDI
ncbi:helix-turn-helix transcriptional regulator [Alkalihalobacillus sp. BA299]|uniref:helix-turn-helix transcriptional regulator n=1 Tax=Alkalihalobacillus sp. BA299 TaxID=2815938 RepID=UPI001ADBBA96|nr:helix-turn-helix transcriptional regulator [Alkalihalobacillus sp. BA299]